MAAKVDWNFAILDQIRDFERPFLKIRYQHSKYPKNVLLFFFVFAALCKFGCQKTCQLNSDLK